MKNGAYKLKEHIKNSRPSGDYDLWTSCKYIPPKNDDEWGWHDPDEFLFVVRDAYVLGRKYQEIVYAIAEWSSGFFIDEVPCKEHFSGIDEEELEEELYGALQHRADEPAPQDFLDALVPVERTTVAEIFLDYAQYEGIDPDGRLFRHRWSETALAVLDEMGKADQELLKRFETGLRMLLIQDANRSRSYGIYADPEDQKEYEARMAQESAERCNKQHKAFHQMHMNDMKRERERRERRRLEHEANQ